MLTQKRAKNVSMAGAAAQLIFAGVILIVWVWTGSVSAFSSLLFTLAGAPLWLVAALLLYCRQLERKEAEELAQLAADGGKTTTIFEQAGDQELRPAAARVRFVDRWIVPVFTLGWSALHAAIAVLVLLKLADLWKSDSPALSNPGQGILLTIVVGFGAFLLSRYATGMSKRTEWRLLRATGSYLLVCVLLMVGTLAGLLAAREEAFKADTVIAFAGPIIQIILAVELLLNFVLDLYRPRIPGQEHRLSFDSRLFNLLSEPERVGHSIAETLNYQFGFEVSRTWFYQLLAKAAFPLLVFAAGVIFAMTSIVLVREGEQYVVFHWGKMDRIVGPGLNLKWPWPIDKASRFQVGRVQQLSLGTGEQREPIIVNGKELTLWTKKHGRREELDFMVAVPPRTVEAIEAGDRRPPPSVNLIKLVVNVQYLVTDPIRFGYGHTDSAKLLECESYREMVRYCASATLDTPIPGDQPERPEAIMTYGRQRAADELKRRIQAKADELDLGVTITYVGLPSVHPPAEAADAYEAVLQAERGRLLTRYEAEAEADKALVEVAGTPLAALRLALAIRALEELESLRDNPANRTFILADLIRQVRDDVDTLSEEIRQERLLGQIREGVEQTDRQRLLGEYLKHLKMLEMIESDPTGFDLQGQIDSARKTADALFDVTVGEPARMVAEADAYKAKRELTEMARAQAFDKLLLAYQASPTMYMTDRWLDVWDEVLPGISKYVVGIDKENLEVRLDWQRRIEAMDAITIGSDSEQAGEQ